MDQSQSGKVRPPSAPAHQVTTKLNAIVLGMKRNIECSRSSQDWPSVSGVETRCQRLEPAGRL